MKLTWLNLDGIVSEAQIKKVEELSLKFGKINVLEIGSAYGGAVEYLAQTYPNAEVYGYDTFEGHPKDLTYDPNSTEATCMDYWYRPDILGTDKLSYEYQTEALKDLPNAHLVKGRVNRNSFDDIKEVHMAMIDLDLIQPIMTAYMAIKDKIVKGGYLMFHDYADNHLPMILFFVDEVVIPSGLWEVESHKDQAFIILKKK